MELTENFAQDCCLINDFLVVIYAPDSGKSIELGFNELVDCEIRNGLSLVKEGFIIFEDSNDIASQLNTNKNLFLYIFYIENQNNFLKQDFKILNTSKTNDNTKSFIRFDFIDTLSFILSKTYKSSYNLSFQDAIKSYINEFYTADKNWIPPVLKSVQNFRTTFTYDILQDITEPFQIPASQNFLQGFYAELSKRGFICFQENGVIRICNSGKIDSLQIIDIPTFKRFNQDSSNSEFYLYYSKFKEKPTIDNNPETDYFSIDFQSKKIKVQSKNLKDSGLSKERQANNGSNLQYTEVLNDDVLLANTYFDFLNNYTAYIVVPTRKSNIAILNKIKLEAYNPSSNAELEKTGDLKYSGEYLVLGYTNKIMNRNKLVTLAKIARFDNTK